MQGKIYVIECKIHLSFPKCILSEWSVTTVHYRAKSMTQKGGALINSFWLLDIINFSDFSEVKHCVVPSTQMQIKQTNVNTEINAFIQWCFLRLEQRCIEKSGTNSSSSTHYIIIDGSCLEASPFVFLFFVFFSFVTGSRTLGGWEVYSAAMPAALHTHTHTHSYLSIDHHTSQ